VSSFPHISQWILQSNNCAACYTRRSLPCHTALVVLVVLVIAKNSSSRQLYLPENMPENNNGCNLSFPRPRPQPTHSHVRMLRWQSESSKSSFIHVPHCDIEGINCHSWRRHIIGRHGKNGHWGPLLGLQGASHSRTIGFYRAENGPTKICMFPPEPHEAGGQEKTQIDLNGHELWLFLWDRPTKVCGTRPRVITAHQRRC
jgi:hypothetical protein